MAHVVHWALDKKEKIKTTLQTIITEARIFTVEIIDIVETIIYAGSILINKAFIIVT